MALLGKFCGRLQGKDAAYLFFAVMFVFQGETVMLCTRSTSQRAGDRMSQAGGQLKAVFRFCIRIDIIFDIKSHDPYNDQVPYGTNTYECFYLFIYSIWMEQIGCVE